MSKMFVGKKNYALMRHAREIVVNGEMTILSESKSVVLKVTNQLLDRIPNPRKKFLIYHSPRKRAELTAVVVAEVLKKSDVLSEIAPLSWLDQGLYEITDENILKVLPEGEEEFVLFISHVGDILKYLGKDGEFKNCSIVGSDFFILGHWWESEL